jgi:hypothetical protein
MSDAIDTSAMDDIPDDVPEELDIQVGDAPPDPAPEVVTLSPAEFAALKAQGDSASAISKGIEKLGERMAYPQAQVPTPVNTPTQSPEEYYAEHADDLFDKEKGAKVMAEFSKRIAERDYGPMVANLGAQLASTKKELLKAKDPMFAKYEKEIDALVASQPANVRSQPDIYDRAWITVRENHRSEIEEETVTAKVNAAVEAALKARGIDPTKPATDARPAAYANSAARSGGAAPAGAKRTVRLPDEATRIKLENEARRRGMAMDDLLRSKGYVK